MQNTQTNQSSLTWFDMVEEGDEVRFALDATFWCTGEVVKVDRRDITVKSNDTGRLYRVLPAHQLEFVD